MKTSDCEPEKERHHQRNSTPAAPTAIVEGEEGEEGPSRKPHYEWEMEAGLDRNFSKVGKLLSSLELPLFQHPDGGLVLVEDDHPRRIITARELAPLLIDNLRLSVTKNGKYHGERVAETVLNHMLAARSFLTNFQKVEEVVTTPIVLPDFSHTLPGFNEKGAILYLGQAVVIGNGTGTIDKFLDVMQWQGNADRTNALAAALSVRFRRLFPGGKPVILVTASKSHAGKGTLADFIRGSVAKAEILYEATDWPMQRSLHEQLLHTPEIGLINFDNVRTDSSGRAKLIRSGFLESFITNSEIVVSSATARSRPIRTANKFVVLLNTNEGSLSTDLLNRSLPIHLNPTGDLADRIARAKDLLGGDVKHEWLPANREQIDAELWGLIDRWRKEGKPLDSSVRHPMGPWAGHIGGILRVAGYEGFLANYSATRSAADPVREAIGILAFRCQGKHMRAGELAKLAVTQGLAGTLLKGADPANAPACERKIGVVLSPYVGESFSVFTPGKRITFRLQKQQGRWDERFSHFRYRFERVSEEEITGDAPSGLVLEE